MLKPFTILFVDEKERRLDTFVPNKNNGETSFLTAKNGQEAWDVLRTGDGRDVELIVCDISSATTGGLQLLQRVRASGLETPFVFVGADKNHPVALLGLGNCVMVETAKAAEQIPQEVNKAIKARASNKRRPGG